MENPLRYLQYQEEREHAIKRLPAGTVVESWLFHGTPKANIDPICAEGFNRSLSGQNGFMQFYIEMF